MKYCGALVTSTHTASLRFGSSSVNCANLIALKSQQKMLQGKMLN